MAFHDFDVTAILIRRNPSWHLCFISFSHSALWCLITSRAIHQWLESSKPGKLDGVALIYAAMFQLDQTVFNKRGDSISGLDRMASPSCLNHRLENIANMQATRCCRGGQENTPFRQRYRYCHALLKQLHCFSPYWKVKSSTITGKTYSKYVDIPCIHIHTCKYIFTHIWVFFQIAMPLSYRNIYRSLGPFWTIST